MEYMLKRPDLFLRVRQRLNKDFAMEMIKLPLKQFYKGYEFLHAFPKSIVERLYCCLQPRTVEPQGAVVTAREKV